MPSGLYATDIHAVRVSLEGGLFLARRHVPQLDRLVLAPRGQRLAVRAVRHGVHPVRVSLEGGLFLARRHVPQLDRLVLAPPRPASCRPGCTPRTTPRSVCPLRVACSLPVATSHSLIVWSLLPEASVLPSGLNATDHTPPVCPLRVACSLPVATSHSLIVWSPLPEASVLPSGLYATEYTQLVCPLRVACSLPVATSHSLIVSHSRGHGLPSSGIRWRSWRMIAPRGQGLAVRTVRHGGHLVRCPWRVACSLPVATSHSLIVLSSLPEASVLPSGLYATEDSTSAPLCP